MFDVRWIDLEAGRVETRSFELEPKVEQAAKAVELLGQFMAGKPREFRAPLSMLNKGSWELEWSAAEGGVAFAVLYESGEVYSMGVLASGEDPAAAEGMLEGFRHNVLGRVVERLPLDQQEAAFGGSGRRMVMTTVPGRPELAPVSHLLNTALAAVYFRSLQPAD